MAAATEAGPVLALAGLPGGRCLLTVGAPNVARLAGPGQFAMLRCADGLDPYLRRPLPFLRAGDESVSFLFTTEEPGLAWLARRRLGDSISLIGPLGRGFDLQPGTRRLLLLAAGEPLAPLLALAGRALAAGASVSLAATEALASGLAPIIPEAVELALANTDLRELARGLLPWADQAAAAGPVGELQRLAQLPIALRPGLVQCYVQAAIACGLGWCGGCLTGLRRVQRRACTAGPVFDLTDLI